MATENAITIIVGVISLTIPLYIFLKGKNREASIVYGILGILAGPLWALSLALFRESNTYEMALFWDRLIYLDAICIAPLFFLFTTKFPQKQKISSIIWIAIYSFAIFFSYHVLATDQFIKNIILNDEGNSVEIGWTYYIWFIWFSALMGFGVIIMVRAYKQLSGTIKDQARYIVAGAILPAIGTLPTNAVLPMFGIYNYIWIGPFFLIGMNLTVAYGLTRTRFWGRSTFFRFIIRPFLLWIISWITVLGWTLFVEYGTFNSHYIHRAYIILFSIFFIVIFLGADYFIRNRIIPMVKGYVNPITARDSFMMKTAAELDVDAIGNIFTKTVKAIFQTETVGIFAVDKADTKRVFYENIQQIPTSELIDFQRALENWKSQHKKQSIVVLSELEYDMMGSLDFIRNNEILKLMSFLKKYNLEVVMPIDRRVNLYGLCLFGKKGNEKNYTIEDINLLKIIVNTASVSISRAVLYREVKSFAQTLEQKVDIATTELKEKVNALEEARRMERDMVDIMGHELRTPISIVKGSFLFFVSLINKNISNKIFDNDRKKLLEYIDRINENVEREIALLERLLSATKVDKGIIELNREKVDIIDVIEDGIVGQEKLAKEKNLYLKFDKPKAEALKKFPFVYADRARIQEVVDNFLNNAVKYTNKGGVTVKIEHDTNRVTIHIHDTGIGIPKEEIKNLGKKFYRVQQYTEGSGGRDVKIVRAGGTGLGLYVTFGLIERHGGKVWVTSEKEKGSTFHFTIPLYKDQIAEKNKNDEAVADVFKRLGLDQQKK